MFTFFDLFSALSPLENHRRKEHTNCQNNSSTQNNVPKFSWHARMVVAKPVKQTCHKQRTSGSQHPTNGIRLVPTRCHIYRGIPTGAILTACDWNACGAQMPRPKGRARLNVALRVYKQSRQTQSARETLPFARSWTRQGASPSAGRALVAQVSFLAAHRCVRSAIADEHEARNAAQAGPKETQRSPVSGRAERAVGG